MRFYVSSYYINNIADKIDTCKAIFKSKFNISLNLTREDFYKEKYNALGTTNNLDLIDTCKLISDGDIIIKVNTIDIFYEYKENNKLQNREEKVIVLTTEKMKEKLNDKNIDNYFIDVIYLIVPKIFNKYKLMTITGVDNNNKNSYISAFILLQYEDYISFSKIFKYLNDMLNFNPNVVHIDYNSPLRKKLY